MKYLVSILIPAYNAEKWIRQTIESALNQSWGNKEIIVVDDGSKDNTINILKKYESGNIKIFQQENMGAPAARNEALSLAQGDYIQWLDHDDILAPNKILEQIKRSEGGRDSRVLLSSAFGTFYHNIERAKFRPTSLWRDLTPMEYFLIKFQENTWLQPGAWLVSRMITDLSGPYFEMRSPDDDGEYFCRVVAASNRIKFVPEAKAYWRIGNTKSLSQTFSDEALESLYASTVRCIDIFRSLEDSNKTRSACVKFLQDRLTIFYPEKIDIVERANKLACDLGGLLFPPEEDWKFGIIQSMFGWRKAKIIREKTRKVKTAIRKRCDEIL